MNEKFLVDAPGMVKPYNYVEVMGQRGLTNEVKASPVDVDLSTRERTDVDAYALIPKLLHDKGANETTTYRCSPFSLI